MTTKTELNQPSSRAQWEKPEFERVEASEAEASNKNAFDGGAGLS